MVDSCIPFAMKIPEKFWSKIKDIADSEEIKKTLEKSPSTTSKVNLRIELISNILEE